MMANEEHCFGVTIVVVAVVFCFFSRSLIHLQKKFSFSLLFGLEMITVLLLLINFPFFFWWWQRKKEKKKKIQTFRRLFCSFGFIIIIIYI